MPSAGVWRWEDSRCCCCERFGQVWHDIASIWIWARYKLGSKFMHNATLNCAPGCRPYWLTDDLGLSSGEKIAIHIILCVGFFYYNLYVPWFSLSLSLLAQNDQWSSSYFPSRHSFLSFSQLKTDLETYSSSLILLKVCFACKYVLPSFSICTC